MSSLEKISKKEKMNLSKLIPNKKWSFEETRKKETLYATHGYHRYPAKFIPQLVKKLILQYSKKKDVILDPFGGCGTTLVESKIMGRNSIGVDVNKIAVLISKAKTQKIDSKYLEKKNKKLLEKILNSTDKKNYYKNANKRLQYWFNPEQFNKLRIIYNCIREEKDNRLKLFYSCCFSNILKTCSVWYSKSIKPMRDLGKKNIEPYYAFKRHLEFMTQKNKEFEKILEKNKENNIFCQIKKGDARNLKLKDKSIDLIITSPPYVTSYEYADIHQLSILWFGFSKNIKEFKKNFIGTTARNKEKKVFTGTLKRMTEKLKNRKVKLLKHINNYFFDLMKTYKEMYRVLKPGKYACIIIGNTEYQGIKILNTEITIELLKDIGFSIKRVIKRKLSSKTFTPYRDKYGRFCSPKSGYQKKIYQYEYIIIAKRN